MNKNNIFVITESNIASFPNLGNIKTQRTKIALAPIGVTPVKKNSTYLTEEQVQNILFNIPKEYEKFIRVIDNKKQYKVYNGENAYYNKKAKKEVIEKVKDVITEEISTPKISFEEMSVDKLKKFASTNNIKIANATKNRALIIEKIKKGLGE